MVKKIFNKIERIARQKMSGKYRCNHFAFIFKGAKILEVGENSKKTHPKILDYEYHDFSRLHAELSACIRFGKEDCSKYSLAVIRIDRNNLVNQSKPCSGCQSLIKQLNFKEVFFTNEFGGWEKLS